MKKMIVVGLGLMLSACAMFHNDAQVQAEQKMQKFMYCAAAHEALGDFAAQEYKIQPSQFTQDDMLGWYSLSGAEAQYATQMYFKAKLDAPMNIQKYNDIYRQFQTKMTLEEVAKMTGTEASMKEGQQKVQALAAKVGSKGLIDEANYDLVNDNVDGECMEMFSEHTTDMNILLSPKPEASVSGRTSGACVGVFDAMSQIAAMSSNLKVAKASAFHSGVMSTFMNSYINDENAEDIYDHITVKGELVFNGIMTEDELAKDVNDCTVIYGVANQYMVNHIVDQPAQK